MKRTWKKQVEEDSMEVGSSGEAAPCESKWSVGINRNATREEVNSPTVSCYGNYWM